MMTDNELYSDLPIPPGEYLEEVLEELRMTKGELARRMNRPAAKLSLIFKGEKAITPETALQLEKVVGVPAHIWTGLEDEYRLILARQKQKEEEEQRKDEIPLVTRFCYSALAKMGVVPKLTKGTEKVLALQKFLGVTSLHNTKDIQRYEAAFRSGALNKKRSPEAVIAWLRLGELRAQKIECVPFNKNRLNSILPEIRKMTMLPPEIFLHQTTDLLAEAGVAFVLCPHLPKTYANGATFKLGNRKRVLMLSFRGKWADIFWFSLFHELGHILLHDLNRVFVEYNERDKSIEKLEKEADKFAADTLIPQKKWSVFIRRKSFFTEDIHQFAHETEVDPGIVVGRLQHEGHLRQEWRNTLRTKYEWSEILKTVMPQPYNEQVPGITSSENAIA